MSLYRFCDITIESNIDFPEMESSYKKNPDVTFHLASGMQERHKIRRWNRHWHRHDGQIFLSYSRKKSHSVIRFPRIADFIISNDQRLIRCLPQKDISVETLRHLLLDHVLPRLLSQHGKVLIHASGVRGPRGIIAFMGKSGSGKSTTAAAFYRLGFSVLSDDCLLLQKKSDKIFGIPSYFSLRLRPDSLSGIFGEEDLSFQTTDENSKKRFIPDKGSLNSHDEWQVLDRIYVFEEADPVGEISIKPLSKRDALVTLVQNSFQLDVIDAESFESMFANLELVATSVPFYSLSFPREYGQVAAVCKAILEDQNV